MQLIQAARENIHLLLEQCNVKYEVTPFDHALYEDCIEDSKRRGYPVDGPHSLQTFLREGVIYGATAGGHLSDRPTQIWISLYTSCAIFVDETSDHFPSEMQNTCHFNDRFIRRESQGSDVLETFADIIRRASEIFPPVASHLITTSTLNFVAANILEHETRSMEISDAAQKYPNYQRTLSGVAEAYAFMVFPMEVPLNDYIQAIPEMTPFIHNVNDLLSFYKEENLGETTNQISTMAYRAKISKLDAFHELTETTINLYDRIVKILEGSQAGCEAFKRYTGGYVRFHTSIPGRYHMEDLNL